MISRDSLSFDFSEGTLAVPGFGEQLGLLTRSPLRFRMTAPIEQATAFGAVESVRAKWRWSRSLRGISARLEAGKTSMHT
jgi:hypothetical protein